MAGYETYGEYFEGSVILLKKNFLSCLYQLVDNGSVIKVHNAYHFKKVYDQFSTPPAYPILADMNKVTVVSGSIPSHCIRNITFRTYYNELNRYL